jgi:hypothetical protein
MKRIGITAVILFSIFIVSAKEYHVSKSGSDSDDGSPGSPFLTIQAAADIAQPGDVITVHKGIYREHVDPVRGGTSDIQRIIYQAAEGERVEIRGSELIKDWVRFKGNTWKVSIPNSFFGLYNPYKEIISGDWFFPGDRDHHTGEVYLNDQSLYESDLIEEVLNPQKLEDRKGSEFTWFCESDEERTYIYANFHQFDPNMEKVEINVRQTCFYPTNSGVNYITARGFLISQGATPWSPPTAEQIGLIGTNWSKGWIIENNIISNSRCAGITLGKDRRSGNHVGDPADKGRVPDGVRLYTEMVENLINSGWNKELVGSHVVRNNEIFDCGQAGICGSLGAIFSTISNNHIYDIWTKKQFTGFEMGGIKIHAAIDMLIEKNHIHNANKAVWLDWMAQGTRVCKNVCYDNMSQDLFLEVNHGPVMVDNNLFLSPFGILNLSTGTAYVHNLVAGKVRFGTEERTTPVFKPHSTEKTGISDIPGGDDRYYNNIFAGEGLEKYEEVKLPVHIHGNVYLNGAKPYSKEMDFVEKESFNPEIKLKEENGQLFILIASDKSIIKLKNRLVSTDLLGKTLISKQYFETSNGSPIKVDKDFFGIKRKKDPTAGPFEKIKPGVNKIRIR